MCLHIVEQGSLLCIFEYKYILRGGELFIHFITLKGNLFLISKGFDDVLVLEGFQNLEFVSEVL
jgi:hypothetical protein